MKWTLLLTSFLFASSGAIADNSTLDAAIGGGLGGAAGAAIGNVVGGRDAAILGGAVGAAAGTALNTEPRSGHDAPRRGSYPVYEHRSYQRSPYPRSSFCPPGQAKKGRC